MRNETLRDRACRHIENLIASGELQAQDRLFEENLAAQLKTSRTPVREALQDLEKAGLVYRTNHHFAVKPLTQAEIDEVFDLGNMLEAYAGLHAAEAGETHLKRLEEIIMEEESLDPADQEEFARLDIQFHDTLVKASGKPLLSTLAATVSATAYRYRYTLLRLHFRPAGIIEDHRDILVSLRARDSYGTQKAIEKHGSREKAFMKRQVLRSAQIPRI